MRVNQLILSISVSYLFYFRADAVQKRGDGGGEKTENSYENPQNVNFTNMTYEELEVQQIGD